MRLLYLLLFTLALDAQPTPRLNLNQISPSGGTLGQVPTLSGSPLAWHPAAPPGGPALPFLLSASYNFTAQAPGGSLTAATPATITLSPVPGGVNGANTNYYIYLSGGTGTPEACLVTGGTAVSGGASGTILCTPANSHSGAWTVSSASGGIAEATDDLPANGGTVLLPTGDIKLFQTVTVGQGTATSRSLVNSIGLIGQGSGRGDDEAFPTTGATRLLWMGPAGGTVIKIMGPIGNVIISDLQIDANLSTPADIGLDIVHSYSSSYKNLNIIHWNLIGIRSMAVDYNFAAMANGNNGNLFESVVVSASPGGSSSVAGQFGQAAPNVNSIFDFASNTFVNCSFRGGAGVGLELRFADNNTFLMSIFGGATAALKFTAVSVFPASNVFFQSPVVGPIIASPSSFVPVSPNFAFPLPDGDAPADLGAIRGYLTGVENTGIWFGVHKNIPLVYSSVTSPPAIANTTAETAFARSYQIPPNTMNILGAVVKLKASGRIATTGIVGLTLKFKIGPTTVGQFLLITGNTVSGDAFTAESNFSVQTLGSSGLVVVGPSFATTGGFSGSTYTIASSTVGVQGFNLTSAETMTLTAQWGTASPSNIVTLDTLSLELSYPSATQ